MLGVVRLMADLKVMLQRGRYTQVGYASTEQLGQRQVWFGRFEWVALFVLGCVLIHARRLVRIHWVGRRLVKQHLQCVAWDVLLMTCPLKLQPFHLVRPGPERCQLSGIDNLPSSLA